jgi:predicted dehydrogenase
LSRIAEEKHLYLATVHQNRYNKAVLFAKEVLSKNLIGKVLSVSVKLLWNRPREYYLDDWHGRWQTDGGVVSQQAFHHLDVAIDLCGSIEEVSSFGDSLLHEIEVDDTSVGVIRFTSGALGTFELTTAAPGKDREASIRILGKEGVLEVGGIALNKIVTYESSLDRRNQTRIKHLFKENFETGYGINHKKVLEIVYSDIVNGTRNYVKWSESVETLKLIHRIYQSQESRSINQISKPLYSFKLGALSEESGHGNK